MREYEHDGVVYQAALEKVKGGCEGCVFDKYPIPSGCYGADCLGSRNGGQSVIFVRKPIAPSVIPDLPDDMVSSNIKSIYVIGSLRNPEIPVVSAKLRAAGLDVFDDWYAAGPEADDYWKKYEEGRGHDYYAALSGFAAEHVFGFDRSHLDRCNCAVLVLPAGRSGHLELGYVAGTGKPTFILHDNPERWDVMYRFATAVVPDVAGLLAKIKEL